MYDHRIDTWNTPPNPRLHTLNIPYFFEFMSMSDLPPADVKRASLGWCFQRSTPTPSHVPPRTSQSSLHLCLWLCCFCSMRRHDQARVHSPATPPTLYTPPCSPRLVCIAHSFTMASMASSGGGAAATTTATTAAAAPVDQSSPSTSRWHSTMQSDRMATKAELIDYRRIYEQVLFVDIPGYYNRSGRYQQVDTARVIELNESRDDGEDWTFISVVAGLVVRHCR